ncbi:DUF1428 domain-containing protein [uncultured Paraglaciecola sp.]|uniref:DUF1428 domain-containing protein n=1 Tax=uncultured Paraglaciecola sp. TaxID=1765024 RepID=UPI0026108528|nr:DUF1428 domain-containing protein [uncultured Paraglaciecola sp.]
MNYIDGFVTAVPNKNKTEYIKHANVASLIFKQHGALKLVECWGDDLPEGKLTSFPMAVKCKKDESVVLSWIVWPSKDVRNSGMEKVMSDPRMDSLMDPMPFDGSRMIYGGFQMMVDT